MRSSVSKMVTLKACLFKSLDRRLLEEPVCPGALPGSWPEVKPYASCSRAFSYLKAPCFYPNLRTTVNYILKLAVLLRIKNKSYLSSDTELVLDVFEKIKVYFNDLAEGFMIYWFFHFSPSISQTSNCLSQWACLLDIWCYWFSRKAWIWVLVGNFILADTGCLTLTLHMTHVDSSDRFSTSQTLKALSKWEPKLVQDLVGTERKSKPAEKDTKESNNQDSLLEHCYSIPQQFIWSITPDCQDA